MASTRSPRARGAKERFDARYFQRYYEDPATRVHGAHESARLADGIFGFLSWFGARIESVLDVGAGTGQFRDYVKATQPNVTRYVSTDVSPFACETYGHVQKDISRWRGRARFDLVVCQGVLPYLDAAAAAQAIENMAAMCKGFLYLEAITRRDLEVVCDREVTDTGVHGRTGAWYRARLRKHFDTLGCGLYCKKDAPFLFYELEAQ
jgi:SAM-dependent methyltransferase